jgi:hypothetical protein
MDIEKEFKQFNSTSEGNREVVYDLYKQKTEIEKKIHIFNVLSFSKQMAEFVKGNIEVFQSQNVSAITMKHYRDYESGGNNVRFELLDSNNQVIEEADEQQLEIWGKCMELLSGNGLLGVDEEFINKDFKADVWVPVLLSSKIENELLELFLNKDLKSVLEFHMMQTDLPSNNESGKKLKV